MAKHREQILQDNDFSAFLWTERCKNLRLPKFFLRNASNYLRRLYPKHRVPHFGFFLLKSPLGTLSLAITVGCNLTLVELNDEQPSLFLFCSHIFADRASHLHPLCSPVFCLDYFNDVTSSR